MGAGWAMRVSALTPTNQQKKSNDLKRLITADPKNLDGREKRKATSHFRKENWGGSFRKIYAAFPLFSIFFCRIASTTTPLSVSLAFF
jgi:hypothetical protein